jgi:hypothetical protein
VIEPFAGPRLAKDVDRLNGPGDALGHRHVEHPELLLAPAEPEAKKQPATRDDVDGGGILG